MHDELARHLNALERDECYRVDAVLKAAAHERTERVFFVGANGAELGPFVRKRIDLDEGLGDAYRRIFASQKAGRRFLHLPRIVDCCEIDGELTVVMEHVSGETLAAAVRRCGPSVALARDGVTRLCDAVRELHEGFDPPLIHRDLKPSNVMLTRDGLTIIDFGIARTFKEGGDEDTRHFGTKGYAPPEQFGYGQTDARSDVYALGLLLRFCLTELSPAAKGCPHDRAPQLVPEPMRQVIERATAFDPVDRPSSVAELKGAFLEAAAILESKDSDVWRGDPPGGLRQNGGFHLTASEPSLSAPPPVSLPAPFPTAVLPASSLVEAVGCKIRLARSRIPPVVGMVWNALVGLTFALFFAVATQMVFFPGADATYASAPVSQRAFLYYAMLFLMFGPVFYLVADHGSLRMLIPALRGRALGREVVVCLVLVVVGFFAIGIATQVIAPS